MIIVGSGDFNANHKMWSQTTRSNKSGKTVHNAIIETHTITPYRVAEPPQSILHCARGHSHKT